MPMVTITRGSAAPTMHRGDVKPGQVFATKVRGDKLGKNYAAIGRNGRLYSVNLATGELASSSNEGSSVTLTGKWEFNVNRKPTPGVARECRRSDVRPGEVFHINGKDTLYAHLGTISLDMRGWLSVPLARTENHAVTRNGDSRVSVIGTFTIDATLAA